MYVSTATHSMLEVLGFILRQQGGTRFENKVFACSSWLEHFNRYLKCPWRVLNGKTFLFENLCSKVWKVLLS